MDQSCDGVKYEKWLEKFSVELKGGCREWQDEVVGKITSAVLQSGGDLAKAFEAIDTDGSGGISPEEFRIAVRQQLPSLAVLSDAQLEARRSIPRHAPRFFLFLFTKPNRLRSSVLSYIRLTTWG